MARLIILGSAAAVSNATHDPTHLLLQGDNGSLVLIDCGANPLGKLHRYGIQPDDIPDMILTHFHPDHVAGVPIMMMQMWLLGRHKPLQVYGLHHCLYRVEAAMDGFQWHTWPGFFPVHFHRLSETPNMPVLENEDFRILAWPTKHFIPTIGLRIEVKSTGNTIGYSCDTEPIPNIIALAQDVDLLLHEASGEGFGHSSAAQAGETATQAGAKELVLIHYNMWGNNPDSLVDEACTTFSGPVQLAKDYDEYAI
jgi:ribonuclease Z